MFQVKICGIRSRSDLNAAVSAGADAVGLNFFPESPRFVDRATAEQLARLAFQRVVRVGVAVNLPSTEVCRTFDELGLDMIQLHGDEPPSYLVQLAPRPVIRAFSLPDAAAAEAAVAYLEDCRRQGALPRRILLDGGRAGARGGTGTKAAWSQARRLCRRFPDLEPVLAGGLNPQNVAAAIRAVGPAGVDAASGVESRPGVKDPALTAAFVSAARGAFAELRPPE